MNTLYIIKYYMPHGNEKILLGVSTFWNRSDMESFMAFHNEFNYTRKEKNDVHEVWIAK